jgi:hypothetical protein
MSTPQVPLTVRAILTNPVDLTPQPRWKNWSLEFELYRNDDGNMAVVVEDPSRLLDFDEVRVISTATPAEEFSELAAALEERWTGYSNGPKNILHQPQDLASIGYDIFNSLFPTDPHDPDALPNQVVRLIQNAIDAWIAKKNAGTNLDELPPALHLAFHSQILHLPWNLLYPFEDYAQHGDAGFLGISCSIEDLSRFEPNGGKVRKIGKKRWGASSPVEVSLQLDLKLRESTHQLVSRHLAEYGIKAVKASPRSKSHEFRDALRQKLASEEIMYFCCHTNQQPPQLRLTDPSPISAIQIRDWTTKADLKQWPVIFLNTCRGTMVGERYRTSFVEAFMNGGAVAVIGAEAEIDEDYAAAFAEEYFRRIFSVGESAQSLGDVAYRTRLSLLNRNLPLSGLLYSVYSRKPVRFVRVEAERKEPAPESQTVAQEDHIYAK